MLCTTGHHFFPELFPTHIRCSGIALIWQLGSLIGSGVLGLVAVKILQVTGGHYYGMAILCNCSWHYLYRRFDSDARNSASEIKIRISGVAKH